MKDAYILLLMDCNQDCLFCSVPKKKIYLTLEQIKNKIDKYKQENFEQITITGGEPTLHPNLLETIHYIKNKGLDARMTTNGTKLTKDRIDELISAGLDYIAVSVHTFNEKNAKYISDNQSYDMQHIFSILKYILTKKLPLYLNITINKLNYKDLPQMARTIVHSFPTIHLVNFNYVDVYGNMIDKHKEDEIGLQYSVAELELRKAFSLLKKHQINFRAERIPLCYLVGFEEYSSDYNRFLSTEEPVTNFIERGEQAHNENDYVKAESCSVCKYNAYCYGVVFNYAKSFGTGDLYPIFHEFPKK